jgi:hypothetical protein
VTNIADLKGRRGFASSSWDNTVIIWGVDAPPPGKTDVGNIDFDTYYNSVVVRDSTTGVIPGVRLTQK